MRLTEFSNQREQRQVHGDDHAADHQAEEHDHDGFESCEQIFNSNVDFILIEISNLLQHGVHGTGLFADGDHLGHHAREDFRFLQRLSKGLAFLERLANLGKCSLDNRVTGSLGGNVETLEDRNAA